MSKINIAVLTVSDSRTKETDTSGKALIEYVAQGGHTLSTYEILPDNQSKIHDQLKTWIHQGDVDVILVTGGTGVTPRDVTLDALTPLITKEIVGFGELFRWLSYEDIGTSTIQSNATAALCKATFVFLLPGSTGAVRLGMEKIILPQLDITHRPCNFAELLPRIREERI